MDSFFRNGTQWMGLLCRTVPIFDPLVIRPWWNGCLDMMEGLGLYVVSRGPPFHVLALGSSFAFVSAEIVAILGLGWSTTPAFSLTKKSSRRKTLFPSHSEL